MPLKPPRSCTANLPGLPFVLEDDDGSSIAEMLRREYHRLAKEVPRLTSSDQRGVALELVGPSVKRDVCWFMTPSSYSFNYYKPFSEIAALNQLIEFSW